MAAPHVSGQLAAFLSIHSEFIGYPHKVKEKLLESCTDLKRERTQQGAGLPNMVVAKRNNYFSAQSQAAQRSIDGYYLRNAAISLF